MQQRFQVGDLVRKQHGKRVAEVLDLSPFTLRWQHNGNVTREYGSYKQSNYVLADEDVGDNSGPILYEMLQDGETLIVTKLMEKSKAQWVVEVKGSGKVMLVDPSTLTEITPYTVDINVGGTVKSYQAEEGQYKVDEIYLMANSLELARVVKVDSKKRNAKAVFKPFAKLQVVLNNHKG